MFVEQREIIHLPAPGEPNVCRTGSNLQYDASAPNTRGLKKKCCLTVMAVQILESVLVSKMGWMLAVLVISKVDLTGHSRDKLR